MSETLEELKVIITGKPEGANQVEIHSSGNVNCYIRYEENGVQVFNGGKWIHSSGKSLAHCWFIRSLSDIERIIELEEKLKSFAEDISDCNCIGGVSKTLREYGL